MMQVLDLPPTISKFSLTVRPLKNNKTPDPDGIPAEIIKHESYHCSRTLHLFILEVWDQRFVPHQWKDAKLVPIYK